MPDSLSKTVPVWCCVLNRTLFPELADSHGLYVPPNVVSESEKSQMLSRIHGFVDSLKQLNLDLAGLRAHISKPIRPSWVTQETDLSHYRDRNEDSHDRDNSDYSHGRIFESFRPVICCTSSRRVTDGEMSGHSGYVQGAGDDTENWAHGLTPPVFWDNADQLLSTPEADLPELIRSLVASASGSMSGDRPSGPKTSTTTTTTHGTDPRACILPPVVTQLTPFLHVSPLPVPQPLPGRKDPRGAPQTWCTITIRSTSTPPGEWAQSPTHMEVGLGARHKAASRALRTALPRICEFACRFLLAVVPGLPQQPQHPSILIADESGGRDLAAGTALALLCWCFDDDDGRRLRGAEPSSRVERPVFNKDMIRARLGRIMTAMPDANPNRATLQSVNSLLMDWR